MTASNEASASRNPYAPSAASLNAGPVQRTTGEVGVWRDQKTLVMLHDAELPDRCVKCNGPAALPTKTRRVYWHHWAVYLVVLVNILLYVIVALFMRKKAVVAPGLCASHKRRRTIALAIGWSGVAASVTLVFAGLTGTIHPIFAALGLLLLLVTLLAVSVSGRIVHACRIDEDYIRLKGCKLAFLDSLPPFPHLSKLPDTSGA